MSILTCNNAMGDNAVIYERPGIIDNHRFSFIKVPPIIDNEMIADSHHYLLLCHSHKQYLFLLPDLEPGLIQTPIITANLVARMKT